VNPFCGGRNNTVYLHPREHQDVVAGSGRLRQIACEFALHVVGYACDSKLLGKFTQKFLSSIRLGESATSVSRFVSVRTLAPVLTIWGMDMKRYWDKPCRITKKIINLLRKLCVRIRHIARYYQIRLRLGRTFFTVVAI
jgi:hypothetical protein